MSGHKNVCLPENSFYPSPKEESVCTECAIRCKNDSTYFPFFSFTMPVAILPKPHTILFFCLPLLLSYAHLHKCLTPCQTRGP